jgi:hypothetical protein
LMTNDDGEHVKPMKNDLGSVELIYNYFRRMLSSYLDFPSFACRFAIVTSFHP